MPVFRDLGGGNLLHELVTDIRTSDETVKVMSGIGFVMGLPCEVFRIGLSDVLYDSQPGMDGVEGSGICDVYLNTLTWLMGEFAGCGRHGVGSKVNAGQIMCIEGGGEVNGIDEGRTDNLKRQGRATSFGQVCAFYEACAGILLNGAMVRHVGRRWHEGTLMGVPERVALESFAGDNFERSGMGIPQIIEHHDEFSEGHAVLYGDRGASDEGCQGHIEHCAGGGIAKGIGTVEDEGGDAIFATGFQNMSNCPDEGIVAHAYVLNIADDNINIGEHFTGGTVSITIEAVNGNACARVTGGWDSDTIGDSRP